MDLKLCYELGRALRYGDPEEFFTVYDTFLTLERQIPAEKLDRIKELARQISELELEDFVLVQSAVSARTSVEWSSDLISPLTLPFLERPLHPVSYSMKEASAPNGSVTSVVKSSEPCIPVEDVRKVPVGSSSEQMSTMNLVAHNSNSFAAMASDEGITKCTNNDLPNMIKCSQRHREGFCRNARSSNGEKKRSVKAFNHLELVNFLWKGWLQAQEDMHRDVTPSNNHHS